MNYLELHKERINFLERNKEKDTFIVGGKGNILLSAPHGVGQVRLGKYKVAEIGSLTTALYLQRQLSLPLIAKTKNNFDDANFDENSIYKRELFDFVKKNDIKYVVDFHGLRGDRPCDVNLGTHFGQNIQTNVPLFDELVKILEKDGFVVTVDQPFMANKNSVSSSVKEKFEDVWSLQIEINCSITNNRKNFKKYSKLLQALCEWLRCEKFK